MGRKDELIKSFESIPAEKMALAVNLIDEFVYLEDQLLQLKKLPMIKHHPRDKRIVKPTPASKLYKEFLQQYNNTYKNLVSLLKSHETEEDSPLMEYLRALNNDQRN